MPAIRRPPGCAHIGAAATNSHRRWSVALGAAVRRLPAQQTLTDGGQLPFTANWVTPQPPGNRQPTSAPRKTAGHANGPDACRSSGPSFAPSASGVPGARPATAPKSSHRPVRRRLPTLAGEASRPGPVSPSHPCGWSSSTGPDSSSALSGVRLHRSAVGVVSTPRGTRRLPPAPSAAASVRPFNQAQWLSSRQPDRFVRHLGGAGSRNPSSPRTVTSAAAVLPSMPDPRGPVTHHEVLHRLSWRPSGGSAVRSRPAR